MISDKSCGL
jgi:hypothetical protein